MAEPIRWQDAWWHQQPDGSWLRYDEQTETWKPYQGPSSQPVYAPSPGLGTGAKWAIGLGIGAAVVFVVMILAAIAIPVFLSQREKAWTEQVEAALENAAIAQESHCTISPATDCYTTSVDDLYAQGLRTAEGIQLFVVRADGDGYCIEARHDELPTRLWSYDSDIAQARQGPCL